MQNLQRRPSGIYVFRLIVPKALRLALGKSEVIISTGTRELALAKLVASAHAAKWRAKFFQATALMQSCTTLQMNDAEIIRLAEGSPVLNWGGLLPFTQISKLTGLSQVDLLRMVRRGKLHLYLEMRVTLGYLLSSDDLELQDPELGTAGGFVLPGPNQMPSSAIRKQHQGKACVDRLDLPGVCDAIESGHEIVLVCMRLTTDGHGELFVPDEPVRVTTVEFVLDATEVEAMRRALAATLDPDRVKSARASMSPVVLPAKMNHHAGKRFLDGLQDYAQLHLTGQVQSKDEQKRISNGIAMFTELMGNMVLSDISPADLRQFRDVELRNVPAHENRVRLQFKTTTLRDSIAAVADKNWPKISPKARELRMQWIAGMFRWLKKQGWIVDNPMAALEGESVQTLAEKRSARRLNEVSRVPFTPEDLNTLFSASWFKTGGGELTRAGTYREFSPHYFWLPLIAVYQGARINEICQLFLEDIDRDESQTWYIDFVESNDGQRLKNRASVRRVPIHSELIRLGLVEWVTALRDAEHERLFPELLYDEGKGYSKAAVKWFSGYKARLGFGTDGTKTFHSFRHTFTSRLPAANNEATGRLHRQLVGHERGSDVHVSTYMHDVAPRDAIELLSRLDVVLPLIHPFNIEAGLQALSDAMNRKNRVHGARPLP